MRFRLTRVLFVLLPLLSAMTAYADTAYFSSEGKPVSSNARPGATPHVSSEKKISGAVERLYIEAEQAAARGFVEGDIVKVVDGIIYKLFKEPDTGRFTFKLYRKVKKKETVPVEPKHGTFTPAPDSVSKDKALEESSPPVTKTTPARVEKTPPYDAGSSPEDESGKPERSWFGQSGDSDDSDNFGAYDAPDSYLAEGGFAVEARHSHFNRDTVLTKRTITTETASSNDTNGVGVDDLFSTQMHEDALFLRYGVTDRAEVYLKAGMAYPSFSGVADMEMTWGAGFRFVLYESEVADDSRFYFDIMGAYTGGSVRDEFTDTLGDTYKKETDFSEMEAGLGCRWTLRRLSFYGSCSFVNYSEDTVRTQVLQAPDKNILTDEMEQQMNVTAMGGLNYRLTGHINLFLEYHLLNRQGPLAGMAYMF